MSNIDVMSVDAIRVLSADAVQKANSGHPGLPLGAAPAAYEIWARHMKHNPSDPLWTNRDRFILSAGHGSALLYSLLHLFGYGNLSKEDMMNFRQFGSLTPGHPEYGHTAGVEATTGPLGAGMGMAVGMAMAEAHMASVFNKDNFPVVDHYTYVMGGDGCMMEGISSEAFSLAGTLGLAKLIVIYDSNQISIEGSTELAFTENVEKRFEAFGFQTLIVEDGNNLNEIGAALEQAKADKSRPSLITVKTQIGYGCPSKQGKASAHGEPLGAENVASLRKTLGWDYADPFYVPLEVYEHFKKLAERGISEQNQWNDMFKSYCTKYPDMKKLWNQYHEANAAGLIEDSDYWKEWEAAEKEDATRTSSGIILNKLKDLFPNLIGGSADLGPSNKTIMKDAGDFSKSDYSGRNIHFGVRELAMAAIGNGIALYGGLKAYVATFFVFSDYLKPMARLSALMGLPVTYILTHDSIGVGEDGPTHEPVEQLAMLRAMPNFSVFRPADGRETAAAWYYALSNNTTPTALVLSRQNIPQIPGSGREALKGGYIISNSKKDVPDAIIMSSGSEVSLAIEAQKKLADENIDVRVVSMPCMELFDQQSLQYKEEILPKEIRKRVVVEAAMDFGWGKYVGLDGAYVTMAGFGASAPAKVLFEKFGFTADKIANAVKGL